VWPQVEKSFFVVDLADNVNLSAIVAYRCEVMLLIDLL